MVWVILKKELMGFYKSPLFYLIAFLSSILLGIGFVMGMQAFLTIQSNAIYQFGVSSSQLNIHYSVFLQHLSYLNLIFMFFIPALTMKLITEEKKMRTLDLLLTSPITSFQIVVGKYLAVICVILSLLLLAFTYMWWIVPMVDFGWTPTLVTALGIFLLGATYTALGFFAASLTENPMIAFVVGVILNIAVWIFGGLSELVDTEWIKKILEQLSMNLHFQSVIEGVIKLNSMVFFLSVIFFFCFLSERLIESARWRS